MKTEAEEQLEKLVNIPTISGDITANSQALDHIESYLAKRNMYIRRDSYKEHGIVMATTRPDNFFRPKVLLAAHVDVSPAKEEMFTLRLVGDKYLGRGVFDMKFSIAGYLQLVDDLYKEGTLAEYDFAILVTSDEEIGGHGTEYMVKNGVRPEVCVLPDSTAPGWKIETVAKGFWRFDLIAPGRLAHGAKPWEGDSASFKLIQALHELKQQFADHGPTTDTLNIGKIHGGHTYNVIPDTMEALVEIRYLNKETLDKNHAMVREICKKYGLSFREEVTCSAVITDLAHPLVQAYMDSVEAVIGKRPPEHISFAASDAPYFFDVGINCIISCCDGAGHHGDEEWISRESFLQFVPILRHFLDSTCQNSVAELPARALSNNDKVLA